MAQLFRKDLSRSMGFRKTALSDVFSAHTRPVVQVLAQQNLRRGVTNRRSNRTARAVRLSLSTLPWAVAPAVATAGPTAPVGTGPPPACRQMNVLTVPSATLVAEEIRRNECSGFTCSLRRCFPPQGGAGGRCARACHRCASRPRRPGCHDGYHPRVLSISHREGVPQRRAVAIPFRCWALVAVPQLQCRNLPSPFSWRDAAAALIVQAATAKGHDRLWLLNRPSGADAVQPLPELFRFDPNGLTFKETPDTKQEWTLIRPMSV